MKPPKLRLSPEAKARTWSDPELTGEWLKLFKRHPFGDLYRLWLINPAVIQVAIAAARRRQNPTLESPPIELGIAVQVQGLTLGENWRSLARLEEWHRKVVEAAKKWQPLAGLTILDVGCGVGYRAQFLTALGAEYIGLDYNADFIAFAQKRFGRKGSHARFEVFDLDSLAGMDRDLAADTLRNLCKGVAPDLVLSINVVEHLEHPAALLGALRQIFNHRGRTSALFFTTSHLRYYHHLIVPQKLDGPCRTVPTEVPIVCLDGRKVRLNEHRRFSLASALRDCGYWVAQEALLSLPPGGDSVVQDTHLTTPLTVNWGLAPFRAFVARPLPPDEQVPPQVIKQVFERSDLRMMSDTHEGDLIREIHAKARLLSLRPGELLLAKHNLGGCLYVVTEGALQVKNEPETTFGEYALLGELEANHADSEKPEPTSCS